MDVGGILQTGVTGFALLLLYLGYKQTNRTSEILATAFNEQLSEDQFKHWMKLGESLLKHSKFFLGCAVAFLLVGVSAALYTHEDGDPEVDVMFMTFPTASQEVTERPQLVIGNEDVKISSSGRAKATVKGDSVIAINNEAFINLIRKVKAEVKEVNKDLAALKASNTSDTGFAEL